MRILVYGINFAPEPIGIGKYTGEMAAWLAQQGHEVRVVTAPPYYPGWKMAEGRSTAWYAQERLGAMRVWRSPLYVPAVPSGLKRLLHLASFAVTSLPLLLRQLLWRPQVVWTVAPALFCAPGALLVSGLCGAKSWLHIQDFEVDAAFNLGMLKGKRAYSMASGVERLCMRRFSVLSTISGRMQALAEKKRLSPGDVVLFPNWVDLAAVSVLDRLSPGPAAYRAQLGLGPEAVVALYSGNMGAKQGLELLAQAAKACPAVAFVFCGAGSGKAGLVEQCGALKNVQFLDLQPAERLSDLLNMADIHLLPQRADASDLVMPSKLTGMLASGRPVVTTAHTGTELAQVVMQTGLVVEPGDPEAFANAIRILAQDQSLRSSLGRQARAYAESSLAQTAILRRFEGALKALMPTASSKEP